MSERQFAKVFESGGYQVVVTVEPDEGEADEALYVRSRCAWGLVQASWHGKAETIWARFEAFGQEDADRHAEVIVASEAGVEDGGE